MGVINLVVMWAILFHYFEGKEIKKEPTHFAQPV